MSDFPLKDLGPCTIIWDPTGVNHDMGPVFGGVTFRDEVLKVPYKEDGHGETEVDHIHTGRVCELVVPMTGSNLGKLQVAIQGSVAGAANLVVSNKVGQACRENAKEVIVKPLVDNVPTADTSQWLHLFLAYPFSNLEYQYDNAGQRVTQVVFKPYPQFVASGSPWRMWRMGAA